MSAAPLRGMRAAFLFFTRIPLGGHPYSDADWRWGAAHAPLVGLVVGGVVGGIASGFAPLGALPAAALATTAGMLITGAFHEDGLADTCDALGGASDRQRVLEILKDSRIGSFGGAALVASFALRVALLAQVSSRAYWVAALAGCGGRVGPIWLMALLPYVSNSPKSTAVCRGGRAQALVATGWLCAAVTVVVGAGLLSPVRAAILALGLTAATGLLAQRFRARTGGITGDFLGATEQVGEVVVLLVLVWGA